jgi:hypothetical protein
MQKQEQSETPSDEPVEPEVAEINDTEEVAEITAGGSGRTCCPDDVTATE